MKTNVFLTIISIMLSLLIGYLAYIVAEGKENDIVCGIGTSVCLLTTLVPAIAIKFETERLGVNIKIVSFLFLIMFLISNFCFAGFGIRMSYYIITNGMLLLIFLAILYKMQNIHSI